MSSRDFALAAEVNAPAAPVYDVISWTTTSRWLKLRGNIYSCRREKVSGSMLCIPASRENLAKTRVIESSSSRVTAHSHVPSLASTLKIPGRSEGYPARGLDANAVHAASGCPVGPPGQAVSGVGR